MRRPDRKELLAFLKGTDSQIPKSIDKSARLEMPTHIKRSAEDKQEVSAAKKARLDVGQVEYILFTCTLYRSTLFAVKMSYLLMLRVLV